MNEFTLRTLAQQALIDPVYPSPLFPPSPYYRFLKRLAEHLQPSLSVELGVCGGGGSLHLALGNPGGRVVGVDFAYDHDEQIQHIETTCPNFDFYLGDSVESAAAIFETFGPIDILFIDTVHIFQRTVDEFEAWRPYLSDKAVVCFDDLYRKEMENFWDILPDNKVRLDALHPTAEGGFGAWWQE